MIRIDVQGAYAFCVEPQLLTVGMVGAEVEFSFDEPWDTLTKCAVFTDGMETRDAVVKENRCTIPHEVLTLGGRVLCVGVYGTNETGDVVIPTVYADVGMIRPGADPSGDESYSPTPDVTTQILNRLERLESGMGGSGNGSGTAAGVSVTHQWNGTVLSVTSASGTSSADLKGEKGDKGDPGEKGDRGEKGEKATKVTPATVLPSPSSTLPPWGCLRSHRTARKLHWLPTQAKYGRLWRAVLSNSASSSAMAARRLPLN